MTRHQRLPIALATCLATSVPCQVDWTDVTSSTGTPVPRIFPLMTYDSLRDVVVLFGGSEPNSTTSITSIAVADLRELGPQGWSAPATTGPTPLARWGFGLAYDHVRGVSVVFSGVWRDANNPSVALDDIWEWDGASWIQKTPTITPGSRHFPMFTFDHGTATCLMFGGFDGTGNRNDLWSWNGSDWVQLVPESAVGSPLQRSSAGFVWDSHRGVAVLHGGFSGGGSRNDTWEWDGTTWTLRTPQNAPPPRHHFTMAFDAYRGRTVLHGGVSGVTYLNDTWEWDGVDWIERVVPSPQLERAGHAIVFDSNRNRVLRFGGSDSSAGMLSDTASYATTQPASFLKFGSACSNGYTPTLTVAESELPWGGDLTTVGVSGLPAGLPSLMLVGLARTGPPSLPLNSLGAPGCELHVNALVFEFLGLSPAIWTTPLPASAVGQSLFVQAALLDPTANALGAVLSEGGELEIGLR